MKLAIFHSSTRRSITPLDVFRTDLQDLWTKRLSQSLIYRRGQLATGPQACVAGQLVLSPPTRFTLTGNNARGGCA